MIHLASLFAAFTAIYGVSAGLVGARRALAKRQSSQPNQVQNWKNDYATVDFKLLDAGAFSVDWANGPGGNFVVGRGYQPARDMLVNYTGTFKTSGAAYLALYRWTENPLVEYYDIESMGNHNPSDNRSATQYSCHQSDAGTYEIWQKKRTNAPSIKGDHTDFQQYWSVRTTMHVGGTINTGNHFRAWAAAGLKLGTQLYMDIGVEGQTGGGNATITVGMAPKTSVPNTATPMRRTEKAAGTCPRSTSSSTKLLTTTTTRVSVTPATTVVTTTVASASSAAVTSAAATT